MLGAILVDTPARALSAPELTALCPRSILGILGLRTCRVPRLRVREGVHPATVTERAHGKASAQTL